MKKLSWIIVIAAGTLCACALRTHGTLEHDAAPGPEDDTIDLLVDGEDAVPDVERDDAPDLPDGEPDGAAGDDGDIDAPTDELPDGPCTPGDTRCSETQGIETCSDSGTWETTPCPLGCTGTPEVRCLGLVPSNMPDDSLLCVDGTGDFAPSPPVFWISMNTDDGSIVTHDEGWSSYDEVRPAGEGLDETSGISFTSVDQTDGGPPLAVFSFNAFSLPADMVLYSSGSNALVILACGGVTIEGWLQASADVYDDGYGNLSWLPGPGGGLGGEGDGAGVGGTSGSGNDSGGGGGAGFGGEGGAGNGMSDNGGDGGEVYGEERLIPLLGGSGGGAGADNFYEGWGLGGCGGGALMIATLTSIRVAAGGIVEANGWGGFGGDADGGGGGGGGSGGGILMEAGSITLEPGAFVVVNGGGGGSGGLWDSTWGNQGDRGQPGLDAAGGGDSPAGGACAGGDGNGPGSVGGGTVACTEVNGGGGGGAAGRIRLNAVDSDIADGTLSPPLATPGTTTTTGSPATH